ncbi:MAG: CoA transferase [Rhodothalassiaceae bacterium]|nr:MAG: CoA transferase [Rhodothalassiaceae bacterium]
MSGTALRPLEGLKVLEFAGIGPAPFAVMWLAQMGARVIRIARPGGGALALDPARDPLLRGREAVLKMDLKDEAARAAIRPLVAAADVLIEGFRPGVMEKMGLGPDAVHAVNPRLVYARLTGWGQTGPRAGEAGHDITYIALSGALAAIGRRDGPPAIPLNLVGDFGGGALYCIAGILAALYARERSGRGAVVDAAMVDGVAHLMTIVFGLANMGLWRSARESNLIDGGAPFYAVYETKDGRWLAVGCLEPQFYAEFLRIAELADHPACQRQYDPATWPEMRAAIAARIREKTRDEWEALFAGSDACVAPVTDYAEMAGDPHLAARRVIETTALGPLPAPAPRFAPAGTADAAAPPPPAGEPPAAQPWNLPTEAWERLAAFRR